MRIAVVGNQDNNAYRLCKWMRELGAAPDLYLIDFDSSERSRPEHIDRDLESGNFPGWMREYEDFGKLHHGWFFRGRSQTRYIQQHYDVALTTGCTGLLAASRFTRDFPFVHLSLGDEVTVIPTRLYQWRAPIAGYDGRLSSWIIRKSLRRAFAVISQFQPTIRSLRKQGLAHKLRIIGYPEDCRGNADRVDAQLLQELTTEYADCDFVLLWLSRSNLDRSLPDYKGSDQFVEAYHRLVRSTGRNVRAIIGDHGRDIDVIKRRIQEAGLNDRTRFVSHMPYWKLLTHLSIPNAIVCDTMDADKGGLGGMSREALSVGAVVVKTIDTDLMRLCFRGDCPIVDARNADTCYEALERLTSPDCDFFKQTQARSQQWALDSLHYTVNSQQYLELLSEALYTARA